MDVSLCNLCVPSSFGERAGSEVSTGCCFFWQPPLKCKGLETEVSSGVSPMLNGCCHPIGKWQGPVGLEQKPWGYWDSSWYYGSLCLDWRCGQDQKAWGCTSELIPLFPSVCVLIRGEAGTGVFRAILPSWSCFSSVQVLQQWPLARVRARDGQALFLSWWRHICW